MRIATSLARAAVCVLFATGCGDRGPASPTAPSADGRPSLTGRVTASGTGVPLGGATVQVLDGPKDGLITKTNERGEYTFASLPGGAITLSAHAEGYLESRAGVHVDGVNMLNFALRAIEYAVLSGRVVDETGIPIARATVTIVEPGLPPGRLRSTTTDDGGEYRFGLVQIGETRVRATARAYEAAEGVVQVDGSHRLNLTLRRLPTVTVSGTVTDADSGAPIAAATVTILRDPTTTVAPEDWDRTARTDGNGAYRFENVTVGNANFSATAAGYQERRAGQHVGVRSTLDFALRRISAPEVFTGQVGWTDPPGCVLQIPGTGSFACVTYPVTMRRSGSIHVDVTWHGGTQNTLSVHLLDPLELFGRIPEAVRSTDGSTHRLAFTLPFLTAGTHLLRVFDSRLLRQPGFIHFTLTLTRHD